MQLLKISHDLVLWILRRKDRMLGRRYVPILCVVRQIGVQMFRRMGQPMILWAWMLIWEWAPFWIWMRKRGSDIAKRERMTMELCMPFEDVRRRCFGLAFLERRALGAAVEMMSWSSCCSDGGGAGLRRSGGRRQGGEKAPNAESVCVLRELSWYVKK